MQNNVIDDKLKEELRRSLPDKGEFGSYWGEELLNYSVQKKWLIYKFLNYMDICCIAAEKKVGKSVLIQQLAVSLTSGEPLFDIYEIDKPCKILYIQSEGNRASTIERIKNISKKVELRVDNFYHINIAGAALHTKAGYEYLVEESLRPGVKYDVIIFDPLYSLMHGGDMNDSKAATMWTNNVRKFLGIYGATGIVIHHDSEKKIFDKGKPVKKDPAMLFGSSVWGFFFTHCFKLIKRANDKCHKLTKVFDREGEMIDEIHLKMVTPDTDLEGRLYYTTNEDDKGTISTHKHMILECLKEHVEYKYPLIYNDLNMSQQSFHKYAKQLIEEGRIERYKDENKKTWYKII